MFSLQLLRHMRAETTVPYFQKIKFDKNIVLKQPRKTTICLKIVFTL